MGAHKYNPVAIAAKEGKLPPKPRELSLKETYNLIAPKLVEEFLAPWIETSPVVEDSESLCNM